MNIKCSFCQMPYTLSRVEMLDALQEMEAGKLNHYDAQCPRCRRATPVQRQRMQLFFPNWRDALKEFEAEMKAHPQPEAPLPKPEPASNPLVSSLVGGTEGGSKAEPAPAEEQPAAKKETTKKSTAKPKARASAKKK